MSGTNRISSDKTVLTNKHNLAFMQYLHKNTIGQHTGVSLIKTKVLYNTIYINFIKVIDEYIIQR